MKKGNVVFLCYGIVDKNKELFIEKAAFSNEDSNYVRSIADLLNEGKENDRAPYKPVQLFYDDLGGDAA